VKVMTALNMPQAMLTQIAPNVMAREATCTQRGVRHIAQYARCAVSMIGAGGFLNVITVGTTVNCVVWQAVV